MKAKVEQLSENVDAVDFEEDVDDLLEDELCSTQLKDQLLTLLFDAYMLGYNRACERNDLREDC